MSRSQKKRSKPRPKGRQKVPNGCPLENGAKPKKTPKVPLVERTETRGMVELKFPGFEATFPGTNRSVMVIIVALFCAGVVIIPVVFYQVFSADPEALQQVGQFFGDEKPREPVKMQVQTNDGFEIIEVCPPCVDWTREDCEDSFGMYDCPDCQCPQCPQYPPPPPPAMSGSPRKTDAPLL